MREYTFEIIRVGPDLPNFDSILKAHQALETMAGKTPVECLALFRHLMADVVISSCFGYRLGAVSRWAMDIEDPLSTAIKDFPKRGILVRIEICSKALHLPDGFNISVASFLHGPGISFVGFLTIVGDSFVTLTGS
jgi:hypothetical protein